jgi:lipid-binding SYLF domain-containing protein
MLKLFRSVGISAAKKSLDERLATLIWKGRDASADTDATLRAEILSYSRSRGLFAGISLTVSTLRPDDDASADVYGRKNSPREIVLGEKVAVPESGRLLVSVLQKKRPHNESAITSNQ